MEKKCPNFLRNIINNNLWIITLKRKLKKLIKIIYQFKHSFKNNDKYSFKIFELY